jgi:biotin-dependent carboxylase-like uncharacterized protein
VTALRVIEPGLHSTVQDLGRAAARWGAPPAGALDPEALRLANALVGEAEGAAALELLHVGPVLEAEAERVRLALVGADVAATVERGATREALEAGRTVALRRGDRLRVGPLRGSRCACLAVEGGFDIAPVLGARATFAKSGFGGFHGRALRAGDRLPLLREAAEGPERGLPPVALTPAREVRVVLGPQAEWFTEAARDTFLSAEWTVTRDADRMGLRLDGPALEHARGFNIVSDGIVTGAVQVPGAGRPIVLLVDRQTSGGYPKIACAVTADLPALGRCGPGARLRFRAVSPQEGAEAARARRAELDRLVAAIGPVRPSGAPDPEALWRENLIQPPILEPDP